MLLGHTIFGKVADSSQGLKSCVLGLKTLCMLRWLTKYKGEQNGCVV